MPSWQVSDFTHFFHVGTQNAGTLSSATQRSNQAPIRRIKEAVMDKENMHKLLFIMAVVIEESESNSITLNRDTGWDFTLCKNYFKDITNKTPYEYITYTRGE